MTTAMQTSGGNAVDRPSASGLADVIDTILDKGLVIDAYVRVSLVGIELLTIDARIVVASVDTYLRFAEAANRTDLAESASGKGLPDLLEDTTRSGAENKTKGALDAVTDKVLDAVGGNGQRATSQKGEKEKEKA